MGSTTMAIRGDRFAPHMALGLHWYAAGAERCGVGRREDYSRAVALVERAVEIELHLQPGYRVLINLRRNLGGALEPALREAERRCPACYRARLAYLNGTTPSWGGDMVTLGATATRVASLAKRNPKLGKLGGFPSADACQALLGAKRPAGAMKRCDESLAPGPFAA